MFLLVLSENAERSIYVPKEVEIAVSEDKIIIPIKIREFELEEFVFQSVQRADPRYDAGLGPAEDG